MMPTRAGTMIKSVHQLVARLPIFQPKATFPITSTPAAMIKRPTTILVANDLFIIPPNMSLCTSKFKTPSHANGGVSAAIMQPHQKMFPYKAKASNIAGIRGYVKTGGAYRSAGKQAVLSP
jgi:hypothetical protein